jgi:hypothetical protein
MHQPGRGIFRFPWGWTVAALWLAFMGFAAPALADTPLEVAVKATYLYKLAAFVEWPSFGGASGEPLQLCVAGDDPFGPVLEQAVHGQKVGAHPVALIHLERVDRGAPCHILYLAPSRRQSVAEALDKVRGSPVLTITDSAADSASRGMVDFLLKDGRVRFRIDDRAAARARLVVSSKLLSLAVRP